MMKYLMIILGLALNSVQLHAQDKDPDRMNRDLKIAEDIVASIFKSESTDGDFYSVRPKATYVQDFGIMINISSNSHFYSKNMNQSFNFNWNEGDMPMMPDPAELEEMQYQAQKMAKQAEVMARMHFKGHQLSDEEMEAHEQEMEALEEEMEAHEQEIEAYENEIEIRLKDKGDQDEMERKVIVIKSDRDSNQTQAEIKAVYKKVMTTFMTDYADLIGQLNDNEKIMLTSDIGSVNYEDRSELNKRNKLSATVDRKSIAQYKVGKLSKEKFVEAILFAENAGSKKAADLELLSSIFQRLYASDLATTYYCNGEIPYEKLDNFGAIFKMKVYSSTSYGKNNHKITTLGKAGLSQEERDQIVKEMYPKFLAELKENILNYGKTVKSLTANENIIFQISLTQCIGCEMPRQMDVSVRQSVLTAYDSGKINKEDALRQIKIKEEK